MHDHDHAHEHDHEHGHEPEGIVRPEVVELCSVGLDIGSTTSHLMVSRLTLQRQGLRLMSRYQVIGREVTYRSPVRLTPYRSADRLDGRRLAAFFGKAYREAGISPDAVDTGVVIATGGAAKKANAEAVSRASADGAGRFVSVAAGPGLEAMLAAHGAGTVARSGRAGSTLLNIDLGGGSCKAAVVQRGRVVDTAAISVGARLVAFDRAGRLTWIEGPGREVAAALGIELRLGRRLSLDARQTLASRLADLTVAFISGEPLDALGQHLLLTSPLTWRGHADGLCFSGGVAEYLYEREDQDYGDLGGLLAKELRRRIPALGIPVLEPEERIRATVIGLSQYTVQLSGSTIYTSRDDVLPLRDLPVIPIRLEGLPPTAEHAAEQVSRTILQALRLHDLQDSGVRALALSCDVEPAYGVLRGLAQGIAAAVGEAGWDRKPLVLVFDRDIGGLVGALLVQELDYPGPVVSIDEVEVKQFDFIDIGRKMTDGDAVPVVVKSLVFH